MYWITHNPNYFHSKSNCSCTLRCINCLLRCLITNDVFNPSSKISDIYSHMQEHMNITTYSCTYTHLLQQAHTQIDNKSILISSFFALLNRITGKNIVFRRQYSLICSKYQWLWNWVELLYISYIDLITHNIACTSGNLQAKNSECVMLIVHTITKAWK